MIGLVQRPGRRERWTAGQACVVSMIVDRPPPTEQWLVKRACRCGPPPEDCLTDGTVVTQLTERDGTFRCHPRHDRERALSVQIGQLTTEQMYPKVVPGPSGPAEIDRNSVRHTTVGNLRASGFTVVHTPGNRVRSSTHASVLWSAGHDWRTLQVVPWDSDVQGKLEQCFNDHMGSDETGGGGS